MRDFEFRMPTEFVFGRGVTDQVGNKVVEVGLGKLLVVYGQGSVVRTGTLDRVLKSLDAAGVEYVELGGIRPNPEVNQVREGIAIARENGVEAVLAVGGGSAMDAAKAIAFGYAYDGDVWEFFANKVPIGDVLPLACVLTIPAAGSEASDSCVISNDKQERKVGVSSPKIRARLAFMDPELTFSLPPYQTAAGVTDMMAHLCERYFSGAEAVPVTDNISTGIMRSLILEAPRAFENPEDYDARANIMWAGMLAHVGIAGCGRSVVYGKRAGGWESHALEHELSAHHPEIAHGAGLAVIMPAWMRYVWREDPERFLSFAHDVFGIGDGVDSEADDKPAAELSDAEVEATVLAGIDALQEFFVSLGMPRTLSEFGLVPDDIAPLLPTLKASKGCPFGIFKKLDMEDARRIYLSAF